MATAVNRRRFEELQDCNTLHVKGIRADPEYLNSEEFKVLYLEIPCNCCGSKRHSLLGIRNQLRTRNSRIQYEYTCPVASYEDIDRIDKRHPNNELTISFWLDSGKYANECHFSPTIARNKFRELENSITAGYEVIMNRFKEHVIEVCQENMDVRVEEKRRRKETLQKEKELIFLDIFFSKPCRICGMDDHSVLLTIIQANGKIRYNYECPSALANDYEEVKNRTLRYRLQICPIKFARACGNDRKVVNTKYAQMIKQQSEWMKNKANSFLEIALQNCNDDPLSTRKAKRPRTSSG